MCEKLLPLNVWNLIGAGEEQHTTQLRLLKVFAEMCAFCGSLDKPTEKVEAIYNVLLVSVVAMNAIRHFGCLILAHICRNTCLSRQRMPT